ncbi:MAG: hypothetical protein ACRDCE_18040 [Cetobacterium sp.]|uniref:hypothetical protein n=1 Tax=Cetobacterium sp. TaxID=2071632 RepID=UPI003EE72501
MARIMNDYIQRQMDAGWDYDTALQNYKDAVNAGEMAKDESPVVDADTAAPAPRVEPQYDQGDYYSSVGDDVTFGTAVPSDKSPMYPDGTPGGDASVKTEDNVEQNNPYSKASITGGWNEDGANIDDFLNHTDGASYGFKPINVNFGGDSVGGQDVVPPEDEKSRYLKQLNEANTVASSSRKDQQGQYNYQYADYRPEGAMSSIFKSMLTYSLTYLGNGGDVGGALAASMDYNNTRLDREHRWQQIAYLEERGYNPKDIDHWVKTGDPKALVKNLDAWQSAGGGYIYNRQSGEMKHGKGDGIGNMYDGKRIADKIDLGDKVRVWFVGEQGYQDIDKGKLGGRGKSGSGDFGESFATQMTGNELNKTNKEFQEDYSVGMSNYRNYSKLADQISKADWRKGAYGALVEGWNNITGGQDDISALKKEYAGAKNQMVIDGLPPGAASDNDIRIFMSGFPDENANAETISAFLRGKAKAEKFRADGAKFKQRFLYNSKGSGQYNGQTAIEAYEEWANNYPWEETSSKSNSTPPAPQPSVTADQVAGTNSKSTKGSEPPMSSFPRPSGVGISDVKYNEKTGKWVALGTDGKLYYTK